MTDYLLTEKALLTCLHMGVIPIKASQDLVFIDGGGVLVKPNPLGRTVVGCPIVNPKPCNVTTTVNEGYSGFVRIEGRPVCLNSLVGYTDGPPPRSIEYKVRQPGQSFVAES